MSKRALWALLGHFLAGSVSGILIGFLYPELIPGSHFHPPVFLAWLTLAFVSIHISYGISRARAPSILGAFLAFPVIAHFSAVLSLSWASGKWMWPWQNVMLGYLPVPGITFLGDPIPIFPHFPWLYLVGPLAYGLATGLVYFREVAELSLAWIVVSLAMAAALTRLDVPLARGIVYGIIIMGSGWAVHDLMHKFTAMGLGFRSQFRIWWPGLLTTALVAGLFRILIAVPGAIRVEPEPDPRQFGIICLAGPLTNVAMGIFFLSMIPLVPKAIYAAGGNFLIGIFNMLPIPPLDGGRVVRWSFPVWGFSLAAILLCVIAAARIVGVPAMSVLLL